MSDLQKLATTLKAARQQQGLSLEQVAHQLKIQTKVLDSIERGEIPDHIHKAIFKGFLRSYCKLMKVESPDVLLQKLEKDLPSSKALDSKSTKTTPQVSPKFGRLGWTAGALIFIVSIISVQTYRKYRTEKMRASELRKAIHNEMAAVTKTAELEVTHETRPPLNQEPSSSTQSNENMNSAAEIGTTISTTQSSLPPNSTENSSETVINTLEGSTQSSSSILELAILAKKPTQITLAQEGKLQKNSWDLKPWKVYLLRAQSPIAITVKDPQAVRIFKNGRLAQSTLLDQETGTYKFSE